jgi:UDPglucose 6-dehydrogenase
VVTGRRRDVRSRPTGPLRLSVVGTGYLGATHAACLAEFGFEVVGVDTDLTKIAALSTGHAPFHEPGLDTLLGRHLAAGRLRFTSSVAEAAAFADVHFLCVGTPQSRDGGAADLTALTEATAALARHLRHDSVVVGKSTVPVGTAARLAHLLEQLTPRGVETELAWNPEFLREGEEVRDSLEPDRLVFGVHGPRAERVLRAVNAGPIAAGAPVHVTDLATAELAKVAANSFLATKISFVNAVAEVCERSGADVVQLADILGDDARIGRRFLGAGVGFGGGCLPKDVRALSARAAELGALSVTRLLDEVDAINRWTRQRTVDLAISLCGPRRGQQITVLGAAFKPFSDDIRDSPALAIAHQLHLHGAEVRVHDPKAADKAQAAYPGLSCLTDLTAALNGADLVLHLTDWPDYRALDPGDAARLVRNPFVVDGRNTLDHDAWRSAGWTVTALGRPSWHAASHRRGDGYVTSAAPTDR